MLRINGPRFRPIALPLLVVVCSLIVPGLPAGASDESPESAAGLPVTGAKSVWNVPYLSMGMGVIRSEGTRFVDGGDAGHAALYGSGDVFDAGAVDNGLQVHFAAGVRSPSGLRAQLEFGLARGLDYRGSTNYRNAGAHQPSEARLDAWQLLLSGFYDFPGWGLASGRAVRPFLGAGVGAHRLPPERATFNGFPIRTIRTATSAEVRAARPPSPPSPGEAGGISPGF